MKVAVFGAGAIGGFIAAALARSGVNVCAVARGNHLAAIRRDGLTVSSDLGRFTVDIPASDDLRDFGDPDFVLLTFKSHQWAGVLPQFRNALGGRSVFVTLQNGLPFWYTRDRALESVDPGGRIRSTFPDERIVGGVVHASGHVVRPGEIHQSGGMVYPIGELDGSTSDRIRALSAAFENAGMQAPIEHDIRRRIWNKLINNVALNPISALTRAKVHEMLDDPFVRAQLRLVMNEALAVARASGADPGVDAEQRLEHARHIADVKTSMLQDLESGRALELDPIAGAVVELAAVHGIPVPHTEMVYALTKLLERTVRGD